MSGPRKPFTVAEDDELRRMAGVAATAAEMARELGRARSSIENRLRHLGLVARYERVRADGQAFQRKCKPQETIGQPWIDEELRDLGRYVAEGRKPGAIAAQLGRKREEIETQIRRLERGEIKLPVTAARNRACKGCGTEFWSTGYGHRHCDCCRRDLAETDQADTYQVAGSGGDQAGRASGRAA